MCQVMRNSLQNIILIDVARQKLAQHKDQDWDVFVCSVEVATDSR